MKTANVFLQIVVFIVFVLMGLAAVLLPFLALAMAVFG